MSQLQPTIELAHALPPARRLRELWRAVRAATVPALACALLLAAAPMARADAVLAERSEIAFTVKQMGVNFDGRFRRWKADIVFRPQALAQSHATVDVDLGSVDLASEDSERESRSAQWFDTARFPTARFTSTAIRSLGGNRYQVDGKLSLKGIARDYGFPVTVTTLSTRVCSTALNSGEETSSTHWVRP